VLRSARRRAVAATCRERPALGAPGQCQSGLTTGRSSTCSSSSASDFSTGGCCVARKHGVLGCKEQANAGRQVGVKAFQHDQLRLGLLRRLVSSPSSALGCSTDGCGTARRERCQCSHLHLLGQAHETHVLGQAHETLGTGQRVGKAWLGSLALLIRVAGPPSSNSLAPRATLSVRPVSALKALQRQQSPAHASACCSVLVTYNHKPALTRLWVAAPFACRLMHAAATCAESTTMSCKRHQGFAKPCRQLTHQRWTLQHTCACHAAECAGPWPATATAAHDTSCHPHTAAAHASACQRQS
jgi:hypothetical protein